MEVTSRPQVSIDAPAAAATWKVGDQIAFSGSAIDAEDGPLPASALDWSVILHDCGQEAEPCHEHELGSFEGVDGGSVTAPDHAAPGDIEIRLTATDSSGQTASDTVAVAPRTVAMTLGATPAGASLVLNGDAQTAPFTRQVVVGSTNTLAAPAQQTVDNTTRRFSSWSDGQPQSHSVVAPATARSFTAAYSALTPGTQTLAFPVEVDSYVDSSAPSANFGSAATLRTDDSPVVQTTYLRFLVAGLAGSRVQSARLRMRATGNTDDGPAVFGTSDDWTENGITWNNRPQPATGVAGDVGAVTAGAFAEWDVTSLVDGDGALSMLVASAVEDGTQFNSREVSAAERRPILFVTVTNDAYARPKAASPLRISLVPAYRECTEPNRVHGGPLAHGSCNPPGLVSSSLMAGTPDANGRPANSAGFVYYTVRPGVPGTPEDDADVALDFKLSDVRNAGDLSDYAGELQIRSNTRITDRGNGGPSQPGHGRGPAAPGTVQCAATAATTVGGACNLATTLDAIWPGVVREGARSIWQMGQIEVLDGGPDGDVDTADNAVFARQGVFVP